MNANRCQICGYSAPDRCIIRMASAYGPGCGLFSTPGRNIGSMLLSLVDEFQTELEQPRRRRLYARPKFGEAMSLSGIAKFAWLAALKHSARNCSRMVSVRRKLFRAETSTFEIPVRARRSGRIPEPSGLRSGIEAAEGGSGRPEIGRVRPGIGIGNQIGTARVEPGNLGGAPLQRDIRAVINGERSSRREIADRVEFPAAN